MAEALVGPEVLRCFLFLPEPPVETLPTHDLRTRDGMPREGFSADVLDLLRDVMFKCYWYRDYLENHGAEPLHLIGKWPADAPAEVVAEEINAVLGTNPGEFASGAWAGSTHGGPCACRAA